MHLFVARIPLRGCAFTLILRREPVVVRLAERVIDLRQHRQQRSVPVVAVIKRNRIEDVPEVPQMREEEDLAVGQCHSPASRVFRETDAQGLCGITEVIALAVRRPVPSIVGGERRNAHQLGKAIDVKKRHEDRIGEGMLARRKTAMPQLADVESGVHAQTFTPRARATRSAEFTPSSWNPYSQYAPAKCKRATPLISRQRCCARSASSV